MSRIIKMRVDTKEIDRMINSLNTLSSNINKLKTEIPKEIADTGEKYLSSLYDSELNITTKTEKTMEGYSIIAQGDELWYEEFGTGDEGKAHPHPNKSNYSNLKGYNTGKTIRDVNPNNPSLKAHGITSGKYWTYEKDGEIKYTQGIPAGMQMFDTSNYLRSGVIKTIMKEKASDVLSKV